MRHMQQRQGERRAGSVTVRHVGHNQAAAAATEATGLPPPKIRDVCNCLSCGKIFFPASDTADTHAFMGDHPPPPTTTTLRFGSS
jgi:hypothetical protein